MAHATLSDLPPEMVGNVFAFVRSKADQAAACLVSCAWRDLMAPMMWGKLETDLRTASPQSLATLLHPESGILSHVRELNILKSTRSDVGEDRVKLVIAAVPRDRIRRFVSFCKVSALTLQVLLQSQRKIEDLDVWSPFTSPGQSNSSDLDSEEHHAWMGSLMPEISTIVFRIKPHEVPGERIFHGIKTVSRYCPKITDLALSALPPDNEGETSVCAILSHAKEHPLFPNLASLRLYGLRIAVTGDQAIYESFDLSNLQQLQLEKCDDLVPFLEGLYSFYTHSTGELEEIIIILPAQLGEPQNTVQAIERLLKICPKLYNLQLDLSSHGFVVKDCVLTHCQTLTSLMIGTGMSESGNHFSVTEMTAILKACTKLDRLAINLPVLDLGSISEPGNGFSPDEEFANMLTVVSAPPALHAFRMLNLPKIDFDDAWSEIVPTDRHVPFCQVLMQNFANQILRFMTARGSNLRVLNIKPSAEADREEETKMVKDTNGHRWPEYNYVRGRVSDITGTNAVVAHPSKNMLLDFPTLAAFMQYIQEDTYQYEKPERRKDVGHGI